MKFVSGLVLIDAPHSALNMLGDDKSSTEDNKTSVKKLKCGRDKYVYVSGQAWRYWWRQTLKEMFGWELSPLEKVERKNQVYTQANPIKYPDDDVFGYMRALEGLTVTRVSPLKNTPLISVLPTNNSLTEDFSSASRHEGDPVPYTVEFYSTILKGAFSLDLESLGRFSFKNKSGFKNLIKPEEVKGKNKKDFEKIFNEEYKKLAEEKGAEMKDDEWILPNEERYKRASETIKALKYLFGGAKQTLFLTDVTPKLIVVGLFDGGINPFISDIIRDEKGEVIFDKESFTDRIKEFSDVLNPKKIFIGIDKGFAKKWNLDLDLDNIILDDNQQIEIVYGSVGDILQKISKEIAKYYGVEDEGN
jgi:CRISPR-associated protein Cst2